MQLRISIPAALFTLLLINQAHAQNDDFFNRGVALYDPIIDVVNTGSRTVVAPVVSADRKYVTITADLQVSRVVDMVTYPIAIPNFNGNAGNVQAPALGGPAPEPGAAGPVVVRPRPRTGVLNQVGMTRLQ